MTEEAPERRFTRASGLTQHKFKSCETSSDSSSSKCSTAALQQENKETKEDDIKQFEVMPVDAKANVTTRSSVVCKSKKNETGESLVFEGEIYFVGDTVYVDSHRPDIPWYIGTLKEIRNKKKESVLIEWFYRTSEVPELIYQTLVNDRLTDKTSKMKYLDEVTFKSKELFSSTCTDHCTLQALRGKCKILHFGDIAEQDLVEYIKDKDNWFFVLSYNPSSRRLASTQGEIRIGSSHQAELPDYIEMDAENRLKYCKSPESQCWVPGKLADKELKQYIRVARSVTALAGICNGGSMEKGIIVSFNDAASFNALEWLHENKYDTRKALEGMVTNAHLLPAHKLEIKWAEEEKRLFEQGIKQFGKHFDKIRREYLPKKKTKDLVEYYYLWKMSTAALNIRYAKKKGSKNNGHPFSKKSKLKSKDNADQSSDNGSSGSAVTESESDESNAEDEELKGRDDLVCDHCKSDKSDSWRYGGSNKSILCAPCRLHFKRFGDMPPLSESSLSDGTNVPSESDGVKSVSSDNPPNDAKKENDTNMEDESDKMQDQSGDLQIDDDDDPNGNDDEDKDEDFEDDEANEEPNKVLTVKFGQVSFSRPSCRGLNRCCRTDLVFVGKDCADGNILKDPPIAKTERTPIKTEAETPTPLQPNGGPISFSPMFRGPMPSTSGIKVDPMIKMEPYSAQAKLMELYQQQEAAQAAQAAKLKMQAEGLYSIPQGLRPPHGLLPGFPGIRHGAPLMNMENHQKLLQSMHPQLQHEHLLEHLEALARQQQQALAAQQLQQQQQAAQQAQNNSFTAERIQELMKSARHGPEQKYLQAELIEAVNRDAFARQQAALEQSSKQQAGAAAAAATIPWQRFFENHTQALAAASAQHRGYDQMASAIQQRQPQVQLQHQIPNMQQQQQQQQDRRKLNRDRPYPFHRLFPIMARRHNSKKQECKLKTNDDEIIFMGTNGAPARSLPSHIPSHMAVNPTAAKPSFSPLTNPANHRLPLPGHANPQLGNLHGLHYANLMQVFQNQNILRGHL